MTDTDHERDRLALLDHLDTFEPNTIPCRTGDMYTTAAWISDEDDEQRVAAAACRSLPCPAIDQCRAYGLTYPRELGAYGGLTETERRRTARAAKKASAA